MRISVLTNNNAKSNFYAEHGLSIYINHSQYQILFDTGSTSIYLDNANQLNVNLTEAEYIVISHGHYDHAGGLLYFPEKNNLNSIIIHNDAFQLKYVKETPNRFNGIPFKKDLLPWAKDKWKYISKFEEIAPNFYIISDIEHLENQNKYYVNEVLDDFHDELILILVEDDSLTLFMGCSHFGVINGINAVRNKFPKYKIKNIIAGMHLGFKNNLEIKEIIEYFDELDFDMIAPIHCTGNLAAEAFKKKFKDRCILLKAGDQIKI